MGSLEGRVAIVTGAGRGIGREHALLLAAEGAAVVVNDVAGCDDVVGEIKNSGGRAVAVEGDASDWERAHELIQKAVEQFGDLHVLVNNAGIGEGKPFESLSEAEWDESINGNLKIVFSPTRAAVAYWRSQFQRGKDPKGSVISTTSGAGLLGNVGQSHYGAAKAGVAALTLILARELSEIGVRINAVAPAARTPMSSINPVVADFMKAPDDDDAFDAWHPRNISPLVCYLASENCQMTGQVFHARGGTIACFMGWALGPTLTSDEAWTVSEIAERLPDVVEEADRQAASGNAVYNDLRNVLKEDVLKRATEDRKKEGSS